MTGYNTVRDRAKAAITRAMAEMDKPPEQIAIAWAEGTAADRERLAKALSATFKIFVEVVANPGDAADPADRAALATARRAGLYGRATDDRRTCPGS